MYGCAQYGLCPPVDNEGKRRDLEYFDEGRIEILEPVINPESVKVEKTDAKKENTQNNNQWKQPRLKY